MKEFDENERYELGRLTFKAMNGVMIPSDFKRFGQLFSNVKREQYSKYLGVLVPSLSDDALYKLVAGVADYSAENAKLEVNSFLRRDDILKGLFLAEADRHGFKVVLTDQGDVVTVPTTIPNVIMHQYKTLIETHPEIFNSANGEFSIGNVHRSMGFNLINSILLDEFAKLNLQRTVEAEKFIAAQRLPLVTELTDNVKKNVVLSDDGGRPIVQVEQLVLNKDHKVFRAQVANVIAESIGLLTGIVLSKPQAQAGISFRKLTVTELAEELVNEGLGTLAPVSMASKFSSISRSGLQTTKAPPITKAIHDTIQQEEKGAYVYITDIASFLKTQLVRALTNAHELMVSYQDLRGPEQQKAFKSIIIDALKEQELPKAVSAREAIYQAIENAVNRASTALRQTKSFNFSDINPAPSSAQATSRNKSGQVL